MFQYRRALVRLRAGDSVRVVARNGLMGRDKAAALRALAEHNGWLQAGCELPDDGVLAAALGPGRRVAATRDFSRSAESPTWLAAYIGLHMRRNLLNALAPRPPAYGDLINEARSCRRSSARTTLQALMVDEI